MPGKALQSSLSRRRWPSATLRTYLVAVILCATLPLALLMSLRIVADGKQQRELTAAGLRSTARAVAAVVERELAATGDGLRMLAQSDTLQRLDINGFEQWLRARGPLRPNWGRLALLDADGRLVFEIDGVSNRSPVPTAPTEIAALAAAWSAKPQAEVLLSVLDVAAPQRATWIGMPLGTPEGARYLLAARLGLDVWQALLQGAAPDGGGYVSLVDKDRRVLARTLDFERFAGQALPASAVAGMGQEPSGSQKTTQLGGGESYVAWQLLRAGEWGIGVKVPAAGIDAAQKSAVLWTFFVAATCLLLGVTLSLLVARRVTTPLRRLLHTLDDEPRERIAVTEIALLRDAFERAEHARDVLAAREQIALHEAQAASRAKDDLLSMLGHELRNPLNAIVTSAEVLRAAAPESTMAANARAVLARQTRKLTQLVDDLADIGQVMSGNLLLARQPIELRALVDASVSAAQPLAQQRRQQLGFDPAPAVWIDADARRIGQVMTHLIENAVKHTPAGGSVTVRLLAADGEARICVEDNGAGISADLMPRIFDAFVQGERGLDRASGGLGLGLPLVKKLVELHGGSVQASSSPQGSVFELRLPATTAPQSTTLAVVHRIGVIDDNPDALASMRAMLELEGYAVDVAADGPAGVAMVLDDRPDIALVDIGLPGFDGYEVARRCRAGGYKGRLIAISGYGQVHDQGRSLTEGFEAHLVKPIDSERLLPLLRRG